MNFNRKKSLLIASILLALTGAQSVLAAPPAAKAVKPSQGTVPGPAPAPHMALPLPGVGTMPGTADPFRPNVIQVGNDRNAVVNVSKTFPNRFVTPFANPRGKGDEDLDIQTMGQNVFVTFKKENGEGARTIFLTGQSPTDQVAVITLVPQDLPAQTVTLQFDAPKTAFADRPEPNPGAENYTEGVRYLFRQLALGRIPEGYAPASLPRAVGAYNGLTVTPVKRYAGQSSDIYTYRVEALRAIELQESMFYESNVQAVAFFPQALLDPGQSTMVYVMARKKGEGR